MDKAKQKILKREYREALTKAGVYQIKNEKTGRIFIGSSINVTGRINRHKAEFFFGSEKITGLLEDWKNYGEENFTFDVLELLDGEYESEAELRGDLRLLEQMWLEKCSPFDDKGYNTRDSKTDSIAT
jgi:group I intron endonuclease